MSLYLNIIILIFVFLASVEAIASYVARRPLQLSAKGAVGNIGEVPVKNRPKWPFMIVGQVAAELWPRGLVNLGQGALEEYRSKVPYKIWARRPLNFWATKGHLKRLVRWT